VLLGQGFILDHRKVEVAECEAERSEQITCQISNLRILLSLVTRDDIEDHGEHCDQDKEENQEDFQIDDDTDDHCHNIAEIRKDFHEEQSFNQAGQDDDDQQNLGINIPCSIITQLAHDVQIPKANVANIDIVGGIEEVL